MLRRLFQRFTDPVHYRKHWGNLRRVVRPPRLPRPTGLGEILGGTAGAPLLVIIAHPDDELFCSALICEAADLGRPVEILCLTRGEGGPTGGSSRDDLGRRREAELRASGAALGVSQITFLGHIDPVASPWRTYAPAVGVSTLALQLRAFIDTRGPCAVVTHGRGGEYWHPAHLLTHAAVFQAVGGRRRPRVAVLTLHAWQPDHPFPGLLNRDDPADLIIDGTPHRDARLAALRAHQSQADLFASFGKGSIEKFLDGTTREGFRVYPSSVNAQTRPGVSSASQASLAEPAAVTSR